MGCFQSISKSNSNEVQSNNEKLANITNTLDIFNIFKREKFINCTSYRINYLRNDVKIWRKEIIEKYMVSIKYMANKKEKIFTFGIKLIINEDNSLILIILPKITNLDIRKYKLIDPKTFISIYQNHKSYTSRKVIYLETIAVENCMFSSDNDYIDHSLQSKRYDQYKSIYQELLKKDLLFTTIFPLSICEIIIDYHDCNYNSKSLIVTI